MEFDTIHYEVEDRTALITFNRPDQLNAISPHMAFELRRAYAAAEADGDVWTLLITGNGRAFCAGADVAEIPDDGRVIYEEPYLSTYPQWEAPQEATPPFRTMTKPIITAVNGLCCGAGLDLVTCGDIAIASERAEFFDPHVSIGLVSGREMVRLARVLPTGIAMRLALTGRHERMSAQRAYELGLISEVVVHDHLLERAKEVAALVNRNAPLAVRGTRLAIRKGLDLPLHEAEILAETFRERVVRTDDRQGGAAGLHGEARPRSGAARERPGLVHHHPLRDVGRPRRHHHARPARGAQRFRPPDVPRGAGRLAPRQGRPRGAHGRAARRGRPCLLRRPRHQEGLRPTRRRVEP